MAEYQHLRKSALSGEEQGKLSSEELKAYIHVQLRDVPLASWQKPDINGLREGDRVQLVEDFNGDEVSYRAGNTGTVFVASTAPAEIRNEPRNGHTPCCHGQAGVGPRSRMVQRHQLERMPGNADVIISADG
jgi:hypothetical protein